MEARELKIGNLVFYEATIDDHEIRPINGSDIAMFEALKDRYSPIPITEEWLLKFGYMLESTNNYKCAYNEIARIDKLYTQSIYDEDTSMDIQVILAPDGAKRRIGFKNAFSNKSIDIQYVHQLQNLYYALTGEELTLSSTNNKNNL